MGVIVKRNKLQMEETERSTAISSFKALIQAKKDKLERLTRYYESLREVQSTNE